MRLGAFLGISARSCPHEPPLSGDSSATINNIIIWRKKEGLRRIEIETHNVQQSGPGA